MSSRPSAFKKGGGRLNGVDGTIAGYEFTTEFPFQGDRPAAKKSEFNSFWMVLSVRVDGADEDTIEPLWAGNADNFEISDDGLTLTAVETGFELGANTDAGRFIASLCEAGFPESNLPDVTNEVNFEPIIGTRCRFVQVAQVGKDGKVMKRLVKKGKFKGKEFDQTATQVGNVLALATLAKAAGKTAAAKVTKGNGKAAPSPEVSELASATLLDILGDTDEGSIAKAKLRMKIIAKLGPKHAQRDDVIKMLNDEAFLASMDGVTYDPADKAQTIALA